MKTILIIITTFFVSILSLHIVIKLEKKFMENKAITIDCKLINRSFKGSTLQTNTIPIVGMVMNGSPTVGVGLSTSGNSEGFITLFNCGQYGILISDNKEIFRKAKEDNKLKVYFGYSDYVILDLI